MAVDSPDVLPVAFFFIAPCEREEEGEWLDKAFLRALKVADPGGTTETRVYRGGLLLAGLCYKPEKVKAEPAKPRNPKSTASFQKSSTERADRGLYATLVGDFVESLRERWHTIDRKRFFEYVGRHSLDATFVPSLSRGIANIMDKELRSHPRYVGAVSPDLGNPLHVYLFVEMMFKDAYLRGGRVFVQGGLPETDDSSFIGAEEFSPLGPGIVPHEQYDKEAPSLSLPDILSPRGLVTKMRMKKRMSLNIHQKVMQELKFSESFGDIDRKFEWDLSQLPDAPEEVNVQARKIADYLLNPDHGDNQGKARFFEDHLSIARADWSFLHGQLVDGLGNVTYEDVRLDRYGVRFTANLPVTGKNGKTATIETGWIVRSGERVSFVTAFPGEKDAALEELAAAPPIVPHDLDGDERWLALYELAHSAGLAAMNDCVPKPLVVESEVYMEGDCGGATIVLDDGRKAFPRWLRNNRRGHRHYRAGYEIPAERIGQSAESAKAYADAFARVLRRNGVECRSEIYYT